MSKVTDGSLVTPVTASGERDLQHTARTKRTVKAVGLATVVTGLLAGGMWLDSLDRSVGVADQCDVTTDLISFGDRNCL